MLKRKEMLLARGVPSTAEDAMVAAAGGNGDSPARAAREKTLRAPKKVSRK
jgi:hypothetical protein